MSMVAKRVVREEGKEKQVQSKTIIRRTPMRITFGEKVIGSILVFIGLVIFSVIVHNSASIYSTNKEIHELNEVIAAQTEKNGGLLLQVVELQDPDRILNLATNELGMTLDDNKVKVVQN